MSIARNILLLSASLVAVGMAVAMATDGDIDWILRGDFFRPADRSVRVAAPAVITTNRPSFAAPSLPVVEPVAVVVTVPNGSTSTPISFRPIAGEQVSLAQELQVELQRVGCYGGTIDGVWTPLSQKSMRAFMGQVNAQLPVTEPDYVLLALVRGRQGAVCSKPCMPEQGPSSVDSCAMAKPAPEPVPAALRPPTILTGPAPVDERILPAALEGPGKPAPAIAPVPGPLASAAAVASPAPPTPAAQQPKPKPSQTKATSFGPDIFKGLRSGGY